MGFLMTRRSSLYLLLILSLLEGCNSVRLVHSVYTGSGDWIQYGGSTLRSNAVRADVIPPLRLQWEYDASAGFSPYSAAIADSMLFVGDLQGELHVLEVRTGRAVGAYKFGSAMVGTPIIDNDRVYVVLTQTEESLICYSTLSGNVEWRARLGAIESAPLALDTALFVATLDGSLVRVRKSNGSVQWKYRVPVRDREKQIHSSPATDGRTVVVGCDDGALYAVDAESGAFRWRAPTRGCLFASPSIDGAGVFVGSVDSSFYCFDIADGRKRWEQHLGAKIYSSQAVGNGRIYVGTAGQQVCCLDEESGKVLWSQETDNVVNASPLLAGTYLYVGCIDTRLYAYDAMSGRKVWEYKTEGRIKTMPVAMKGLLFVLAEDRTVLGFTEEKSGK